MVFNFGIGYPEEERSGADVNALGDAHGGMLTETDARWSDDGYVEGEPG